MQFFLIATLLSTVIAFQPNQDAQLGKTKSWPTDLITYGTLGQRWGSYSCSGLALPESQLKSAVAHGATFVKHDVSKEGVSTEPHWQTIIKEKDRSFLIVFDEISGNGLNLRGVFLQRKGQDWKTATTCNLVP